MRPNLLLLKNWRLTLAQQMADNVHSVAAPDCLRPSDLLRQVNGGDGQAEAAQSAGRVGVRPQLRLHRVTGAVLGRLCHQAGVSASAQRQRLNRLQVGDVGAGLGRREEGLGVKKVFEKRKKLELKFENQVERGYLKEAANERLFLLPTSFRLLRL